MFKFILLILIAFFAQSIRLQTQLVSDSLRLHVDQTNNTSNPLNTKGLNHHDIQKISQSNQSTLLKSKQSNVSLQNNQNHLKFRKSINNAQNKNKTINELHNQTNNKSQIKTLQQNQNNLPIQKLGQKHEFFMEYICQFLGGEIGQFTGMPIIGTGLAFVGKWIWDKVSSSPQKPKQQTNKDKTQKKSKKSDQNNESDSTPTKAPIIIIIILQILVMIFFCNYNIPNQSWQYQDGDSNNNDEHKGIKSKYYVILGVICIQFILALLNWCVLKKIAGGTLIFLIIVSFCTLSCNLVSKGLIMCILGVNYIIVLIMELWIIFNSCS